MEIERCPECGIPTQIVGGHRWLNSGVIELVVDPSIRMCFVECENLDPLFHGIEKLIGVPIQDIIIDVERKGTRDYLNPFIPREVKDMLRKHEITLDPLIEATVVTAKVNGLGRLEPKSYRYEIDDDDYICIVYHDPHSLPLSMGDMAGGCEAVVERENSNLSYIQLSPGVFQITAAVTGLDAQFEDRLERKKYILKQGDIELERCSTCGGPAELSSFHWDLDKGTITSDFTGRRISIVHPSVLDAVFDELENQLGDTIPDVVVEAQRRFVRTGFYAVEEISDQDKLRTQLALRGLGNLRRLSMDSKGLYMRLENACLHLMTVGMLQGLFERAFGVESEVDWELSEDGELRVDVVPKARSAMLTASTPGS